MMKVATRNLVAKLKELPFVAEIDAEVGVPISDAELIDLIQEAYRNQYLFIATGDTFIHFDEESMDIYSVKRGLQISLYLNEKPPAADSAQRGD